MQQAPRPPFAKCLQLPARSDFVPEGQGSSSLAGCAIPAWVGFAQGSAPDTALLWLYLLRL